MKITPTTLDNVYIIELEDHVDCRGYFRRIFDEEILKENNIDFHIVQVSQSMTKNRGTLRGMHYQSFPKEEKKIIQCTKGGIYDVVININAKSTQYGKHLTVELSEKEKKLIYIPEGFAHGFVTLTDNCLVEYFMNEYYSPEHSTGVAWNDPFFSINWPIKNPLLSEKDNSWPFIKHNE